MGVSQQLKSRILSARQLVELYFGVGMVTNIVENFQNLLAVTSVILGPDPRRIKYEIILANTSATLPTSVQIGFSGGIDLNAPQVYNLAPGATIVIERTFFSDLDSVTLPLWGVASGNGCFVSTREVFLTPPAVTEPE